ncbi:hypothetical protein FFK22_009800 [Mycobacterium sp. KBS0706]|uniref:hypothetical protein n=1 Tax=Mycobacterium sp. KBS0706 TaxID=2578109 RepID=UPI00110F6C3C|nr:hypothetical protein [Mycobacterium sp. KBS0706]TSD89003.1 hypothetical protein FFK22_009800 [Mycobacterium sp. KBS0706]
MTASFSTEARHRLGTVLEGAGFRWVAGRDDPQSFGDGYVDAFSPIACLRIVRDRGQVFLQARPADAEEWMAVERLVPALPGPAPTLDAASSYLEAHLSALVAAVAGP